jgi:signal transduction histidine kinase/DNA-binding NarL/FixJ family response regulator
VSHFAPFSASLAAINFVIAIAVFASAPRRRDHGVFALLGIGLCGWSAAWFLSDSDLTPRAADTLARLAWFAVAFLPLAVLHHLHLALGRVPPRHVVVSCYIVSLVGAGAIFTPWFSDLSPWLVKSARENPDAPGAVSGLALLAAGLFSLAFVLREIRSAPAPAGRSRMLIAASFEAILLGIHDLLPSLGVSTYPFTQSPPLALGAFAPALYVLLFAHGFVTEQWIELRISVGRWLEPLLRTALLLVACAGLMAAVHVAMPGLLGWRGMAASLGILLVGQLIVGLLSPRVLWRYADGLRRKIYGNRFDHLDQLRSLSTLPGREEDMAAGLATVCEHLRDTFRLGLVEVWLRDTNGRPTVIPPRPGLTEANLPSRWDDVVRESVTWHEREDLWVIPLNSIGSEPLGYLRLLAGGANLRLNKFERQAILELAEALSRQIEREAVRSSLDLRQVNEAKDRFLASINHELRNPLNGITGLLQLIRREDLRGRSSYLVETMQACADQLVATIDNALDFASLTHGSPVARPGRFELGSLVRGSTAHLIVGAEDRIVHRVPDDACWLIGDAGKLRQIVSNYAGNALKYGQPPKAEVHAFLMNGASGDTQLRIEVSSPWAGDPGEDPAELFKPFRRGRRAVETGVSGSGLGLAICQRLAESMGGSVGARREGGTIQFWVRVPVSPASPPSATNAAPPVLASRPLRVLAIEDEAYNRLILNHHLVSWGFDVEWACDAVQAKAKIGEYNPDVVIMDWLLGDADGAVLLPKLRAAQAGEPAPVIVLSAYSTEEKQSQAIAAGACRFLSKPLQPEALLEAIRDAVAHLNESKDTGARAPRALPSSLPTTQTHATPPFDVAEAERALRTEWAGVLGAWQTDRPLAARHAHRMRGIARLLALTELAQLLARLEVALVESDDASAIADTIRAATELLERQPHSSAR